MLQFGAVRYPRMANIPAGEEPSGRAHRAVGFRLPLHSRTRAGQRAARIWCLRAGLDTGYFPIVWLRFLQRRRKHEDD